MNNLIIYIFIFILCISSLLVSILYFINQQSSLQPKVSQSLISITSSTQPPQISIASSTEPPKVSSTEPPKVSSTEPPKVSSTEPPKVSSTEPPKVSIIEQGTFIGKPKEPIMCSRKYEPVKCPDGNTYNNSCAALNSGWKNCIR